MSGIGRKNVLFFFFFFESPLMINGTAIFWRSIKQSTISKAACEAEFKSAFDAANEAVFVLKLLKDIGEPQSHILHFIDNDAPIVKSTKTMYIQSTMSQIV